MAREHRDHRVNNFHANVTNLSGSHTYDGRFEPNIPKSVTVYK